MGFQRHARHPGVILLALVIAAILVLVGYPRMRSGQDTPSGVRVAVAPQPDWKALTPEQKAILAPLEEDWNNMERFRRKKWLEIAARYPRLSEAEQERLRARMQDWANLTPAQRQAARERYKELSKKTNAEEREALAQKWADYQNLPESVRQQLEQDARTRRRRKNAPPAPRLLTANQHPFTPKRAPCPAARRRRPWSRRRVPSRWCRPRAPPQ